MKNSHSAGRHRPDDEPFRIASRATWLIGGVAAIAALACLVAAPRVQAVPSFARQTGMQCTSCHTAFPQLTPMGRSFKLNGYTMSNEKSHLPPLAVMLQGAPGFTHTREDQATGELPSYFNDNNNVSLNQISLFYAGRLVGPYGKAMFGEKAGKIANKVGVFAQGTWDGVERAWAWDNMEARVTQATEIAGKRVVLGAYTNNNPTLQDLWNTTPAWGFPYSGSGLAPAPAAAPLLAGGLSQQVMGLGGYAMVDQKLYLEAGGYSTLSASAQSALGVDPTGETEIDRMAPYWRVALEKGWGAHLFEVGTYGLHSKTFPQRDSSAGYDRITDVALDLQYQWMSARNDVSFMMNWIYEIQNLDASQRLGFSTNSANDLWTLSLTGTYLFDKTYGIDIQYFQITGDSDVLAYGSATGSPNSNGWVFQINYLPLNKRGGPGFWRFSNVKLSLQYTLYQKFDGASSNYDGAGRNASDNDTLYLEAWLAF